MREMYEAAMLDMNGLLFNDEPASHRAFRTVLGSLGLPLKKPEYKRFFAGKTSVQGMRDYLAHHHVADQYELAVLLGEVDAVYERIVGRIEPEPGVVEFVGELAVQGSRTAIITSASRREAAKLLDAHPQIAEHIELVVTGDDVVYGKPNPEGLIGAAREFGIKPDRCVMFGDAPVDIALAKAAGALSVVVNTTHTARQLQGADRIVHALSANLARELYAPAGTER